MSAFASMLAAVHADTNIGTPADFRHPPGPWVPARVVLSLPTDTIGGLDDPTTHARLAATPGIARPLHRLCRTPGRNPPALPAPT